MMTNQVQETLVTNYQQTNNEAFLNELMTAYHERIQGRAYKASKAFGVNAEDCESALMQALWTCATKWDAAKSVPFDKYVSVVFRRTLDNVFQGAQYKDGHLDIVYGLSSGDTLELVDMRQDVANLYEEQEAAKELLKYIASRKEVYATVAALRASGHAYATIAKSLGYNPEGVKSVLKCQEDWTSTRLVRTRKIVNEYYFDVLKVNKLPINISM